MSILPGSFGAYVDRLESMSAASARDDDLRPHLDGEVSRRLRTAVKLADLREISAFFTGEALAARLLSHVPPGTYRYADPACGCGDLLLAASARLPVSPSLEQTLRAWDKRLVGRDAVADFARAARARLTLAAISRGAVRCPNAAGHAADLLTNISDGDGRELDFDVDTAILLNPPYGRIRAPTECDWTSGLTTEAALFLDGVIDRAAAGVRIAAVLPEVIRAGSRYGRFRQTLTTRLAIDAIEPAGIFDALTDVDVFLLSGKVGGPTVGVDWPGASMAPATLADICDIRVGAVVANRDSHAGPWQDYVDAWNVGTQPTITAAQRRRFRGTVFTPPFVVVGRTNRPARDQRPRLRATIVVGDRPVALENHLLAFLPHTATLAACRTIAEMLQAPATTAYLDQRLRCRHLTVQAMRAIPA